MSRLEVLVETTMDKKKPLVKWNQWMETDKTTGEEKQESNHLVVEDKRQNS